MFAVRRLRELGATTGDPSLYERICLVDLTKAYDSVNYTLLWAVLQRLRVPH